MNFLRRLHAAAASGRRTVIGIPYLWLLLTFLLPFLIVARISVSDSEGEDPLGSIVSYADGLLSLKIRLANYLFIFNDELYLYTYASSIKYALITTVLCLLAGYPFAYFIARARTAARPALLMLVMLPFWTSFLLRIYAWKGILDNQGIVNHLLLRLGWIDAPLPLMHTEFSLLIGMVYAYLPFMILPLYANLAKQDLRLIEAATDLGATPWQAFWRVTVPLSRSGIIAGAMLVFIPAIGEYVIPELLGGPRTLMIGHVLWDEFFTNNDWPMASAVTVVVVLLILVPMTMFNQYQAAQAQRSKA